MDWNHDGQLDILSGCYWTDGSDSGHIQILAGQGGLEFEAAADVTNAQGRPLKNMTIEEGTSDPNQTETICTHQHAVDYDGDGDLDMVVGCFASSFYLYLNEGTAEEPALGEPSKLGVSSPSYHTAPHLVDWDNDGDLDLLSGAADGGAIWSRNVGTRAEPKWSEFERLIAKSDQYEQTTDGGQEIQPSPSTRVWATDWDGDGLLDLLVGDSAYIVNRKEGVSDEELKKFQDEYNAAMTEYREKSEPLRERYMKLLEDGIEPDDERMQEVMQEMREASQDISEITARKSQFQDEQRTGFVWLYLRRAASLDQVTAPDGS